MSGYRLNLREGVGTGVDGARKVTFKFDGRDYEGLSGDTLASALLANGVDIVARSFKYHRPRGIFSAGAEEPSALVTLRHGARREPNVRATQAELFDGLIATGQNAFPSVRFDLGAVNRLPGRAFAAGFYYKTFMGPRLTGHRATAFWKLCEGFIRRAAGMGRAADERDPDRYARTHAFCDVLVVGAGAAGLAAALRAGRAGARVMLADENARLGGALVSAPERVDGRAARDWAAEAVAELEGMENVTLLPRTAVQSHFDGNVFLAVERVADHMPQPPRGMPRQRSWRIQAKAAVIATGAIERPIVFPGNDRPGVMLADAARRYAVEYGVAPGRQVAVFTNNDTGWLAARDMARCGVVVSTIIDPRADVPDAIRRAGEESGAELRLGAVVASTSGRTVSGGTTIAYDERTGAASGERRAFAADCIAVSGGWSPTFHLTSQKGGKPVWNAELSAFLPGEPLEPWHGAGAMAGAFGLERAFATGSDAAARALADAGAGEGDAVQPAVDGDAIDYAPLPLFEVKVPGKAFVDLQHDVTADDVRLAHREGFVSVEHLKRYTTLGMATDQGKTSNVTGLAIMADARDLPIPEVGTTRFRPPWTPVALGAIAGDAYGELRPHRLTPSHDRQVAAGGRMQPAGLWHRPEAYCGPGESVEQAYIREARTVREGVGIVDVSTLGKIDVQGPDAAEFLNRLYTNGFAKLPMGKARYGLMLREDGFLFDDGTTWRLGEHRYLMTCTTAGAGLVMEHLEYHRDVVWPDLRVAVASVTDQWAGVAVAGPKSRTLLQSCVEGCDLTNEGLPFMGVREGSIAGIPVWIARLSFSGENAYEVYCGAHFGEPLWDALMAAGEPFGVTPYGMEALGTLRIEKGHVTHAEMDGRTTPHDLGLGQMVSTKKDFIGNDMLKRPAFHEDGRLQLVGLRSLDGSKIRGGSHIVSEPRGVLPERGRSQGHTTATCFSPAVGAYVALALLRDGAGRHGEHLFAANPIRDAHTAVEVVSPHMVDPEGERVRG